LRLIEAAGDPFALGAAIGRAGGRAFREVVRGLGRYRALQGWRGSERLAEIEAASRRAFPALFLLSPDDNTPLPFMPAIRNLCRLGALALGTLGHITALRRTRVGPFRAEDAISLDALRSFGDSAAVLQHMLPVETALDDIPALALTDSEARRLRSGQAVPLLRKMDLQRIAGLRDGDTVLALGKGKPVALTRYSAGEVHPLRVLNL